MSQLTGFLADLLVQTLQSSIGIQHSANILDCCARDTGLVFALMKHFNVVGSNDINAQLPTQTHFDVQDPHFWQTIVAPTYHGICSQPPRSSKLINVIVSSSLRFCSLFCALLLRKQDLALYNLSQLPSPNFVLNVNEIDYIWMIWFTRSPLLNKDQVLSSSSSVANFLTLTLSTPTRYLNFPSSLLEIWAQNTIQFLEVVDAEIKRPFSWSYFHQFNHHLRTPSPSISSPSIFLQNEPEFVPLLIRKNPSVLPVMDEVERQALRIHCPIPRHAQSLNDSNLASRPSSSSFHSPSRSMSASVVGPSSMISAFSPPSTPPPATSTREENSISPCHSSVSSPSCSSSPTTSSYYSHSPNNNNNNSDESHSDDRDAFSDPTEHLCLKGGAAASQGQTLQHYIDKYSNIFSKREVITKVCNMKYRSAQRKLRIAKYINQFPEIASMTQRQAERYISEKLKNAKNHKNVTKSTIKKTPTPPPPPPQPTTTTTTRKTTSYLHNYTSVQTDFNSQRETVPLAIVC
jgi:hypothetical protein